MPDVAGRLRTRSKLNVYFERGAYDLSSDALATIAANAERLKSNRELTVDLVGFTDDHSSGSYSIALANRRTSAVSEVLVQMGVARTQIHTSAYGEERPETLPCASETCRISYRRVEFRYLKPYKDKDVVEKAAPVEPPLRARSSFRKR